MSAYIKTSEGFIINTDDSHYKAILAARESEKQTQELKNKLHDLETELVDIRSLLQQVLNRK